ncbi:DUF3883 domain-containing protein [Nocardia sp. NPDC050712]|uniref:DUF3883 domain-containing protein n=1 Tax=Nocardia sp. NPDC050712 TaxID=3155518 RepID=UPI0033D28C26
MALPHSSVLRAALRWLEHLPSLEHLSSQADVRLRAVFSTVEQYSDLTPSQYDAGFAWLREVGLLDNPCMGSHAAGLVFDAALMYSEASWLPDSDALIGSPAELPADVQIAAAELGIDDVTAFARLSALCGKVDTEERLRVGNAGELALIFLLNETLPEAAVDHVASRSDGFGYDIAVSHRSMLMHLEVKSTVRRGRVSFYLSRNEERVMRQDPDWILVVARLDSNLDPVTIATIPRDWIIANLPHDNSAFGKWQSCRLDVPKHILTPGLPADFVLASGIEQPVLAGTNGWPGG